MACERGIISGGFWRSSRPCASGADWSPKNLALSALGASARSWEPGVTVVPEHEPSKVNDGSLLSYWAVRDVDLPADIGVEWREAHRISSVVVRYFDGRMVRGPVMARTQEWARLQYWDQNEWNDIQAQVVGQETSSVRYAFDPVETTRRAPSFFRTARPGVPASAGPIGHLCL